MESLKFTVVPQGYDPQQVSEYVTQIQQAYTALHQEYERVNASAAAVNVTPYIEENSRLKEQIKSLMRQQVETAARTPQYDPAALGKVLLDARGLADKIVSEAKTEADNLLTVARAKEVMIQESTRAAGAKANAAVSSLSDILVDLNRIMEEIRKLSYEDTIAGAAQPGLYGTAGTTAAAPTFDPALFAAGFAPSAVPGANTYTNLYK